MQQDMLVIINIPSHKCNFVVAKKVCNEKLCLVFQMYLQLPITPIRYARRLKYFQNAPYVFLAMWILIRMCLKGLIRQVLNVDPILRAVSKRQALRSLLISIITSLTFLNFLLIKLLLNPGWMHWCPAHLRGKSLALTLPQKVQPLLGSIT